MLWYVEYYIIFIIYSILSRRGHCKLITFFVFFLKEINCSESHLHHFLTENLYSEIGDGTHPLTSVNHKYPRDIDLATRRLSATVQQVLQFFYRWDPCLCFAPFKKTWSFQCIRFSPFIMARRRDKDSKTQCCTNHRL